MELMSSLLLCALVAYFPQALGENVKSGVESKIKKLKDFDQQSPVTNRSTDLQSVPMEVQCKKCKDCEDRAIEAYKTTTVKTTPANEDESKNRIKRDTTTVSIDIKPKNKTKKKPTKTVTVTKYNVDGEVYGLKVKESDTSTCRIYSVKKSYDCDTPESEAFLSAKRKLNKKSKKEKERTTVATSSSTMKPVQFSAPSFRKRQIDSSGMPENYEFSIEEMY